MRVRKAETADYPDGGAAAERRYRHIATCRG
jgi:hypothetical protein